MIAIFIITDHQFCLFSCQFVCVVLYFSVHIGTSVGCLARVCSLMPLSLYRLSFSLVLNRFQADGMNTYL